LSSARPLVGTGAGPSTGAQGGSGETPLSGPRWDEAVPGKRIGVLGTLVWDEIWRPDSPSPREQWGGIAYSLAAFSAACPGGWSIVPIVRIGEDLAAEALAFLARLPGQMDDAGVRIVPERNNRVELRYLDEAERTERLSGGVSGWEWSDLAPLVSQVDALYVNFVSGFELSLSTAILLGKGARGPLFADLHSLFLDTPGPGPRGPRRLPDWGKWLGSFDVVQMNAAELSLLGPPRLDPFSLLPDLAVSGPGIVLVTEGARGARFATSGSALLPRRGGRGGGEDRAGGEVRTGLVPNQEGVALGDPTGCGDVWGSVVFCGLLAGDDLPVAIARGHRAASARVRTAGIDDLPAVIARSLQRDPDKGDTRLPPSA